MPEVLDKNVAWARAVKKQASWKAPGPDGIPASWYKVFKAPAALLQDLLWSLVEGPEKVSDWFVRGRTVMLLKDGCEDQFRLITCLNTDYKLLTEALAAILMEFVGALDLLPERAEGSEKGNKGLSACPIV